MNKDFILGLLTGIVVTYVAVVIVGLMIGP